MLFSTALLSLTMLTLDAEAANVPKIRNIRVRQISDQGGSSYKVVATSDGPDVLTDTLYASVDGGDLVAMEPVDYALHGGATVDRLPVGSATVSLVVYDVAGEALRTFTGSLEPDGTGTLSPVDAGPVGEEGEACSDCATPAPDIEVLGFEAFSELDGAYALTVDLDGVDALDASTAVLTLTERVRGEEVCVAWDEEGNCLEWRAGGTTTVTTADVSFDAPAMVWESDLATAEEGAFSVG